MEIVYKESKEELFKLIADKLKELMEMKNKVILAVPGGRSVALIFENLVKEDIDWHKVHIFMVDERMVELNDKDSNFKILKDHLIMPAKISQDNIHPFKIEEGIKSYKQELEELGGSFDIILLSSGEDGHIAALYPNHNSIKNNDEFFISMEDSPKPPKDRMSSSRNLLERSKNAVLMFIGESKMQAYKNFLNNDLSIEECPAKLLNEVENLIIYTDLK